MPPCFVNAKACAGHLLGTDEVGRDLLARLIVGGRVTLGVSLLALLFEVAIATGLGLLARTAIPVKYVVMRVAEAISCLSPWPFMAIIILILISAIDPHVNRGVNLAVVALWVAVLSWPNLIRVTWISWSRQALLSQAARDWAKIILVLATIDFFGFGTFPPTPSWGNMLFNLQGDMQIAWWAAVFPAACIFLTVLSIEIFARTIFRIGATEVAVRARVSKNDAAPGG
ncbi:MAG: hypothetical protein NVSMB31_14140 [Vulcanimicrobiaceae bacterium]